MYEGREKNLFVPVLPLQFDHSSGSVSRGYRSLQLIIKYSRVTARTNTQSHLLISFLHHCVWLLSLDRKQGSASPVPVSPGTKTEKKCTPCCLRHKRSIKRVGWPRSLANRKQPSNLQQKPVCHPVATFKRDHQPISGKVLSDSNLDSRPFEQECWRATLAWLAVHQKAVILFPLPLCFRKWNISLNIKNKAINLPY